MIKYVATPIFDGENKVVGYERCKKAPREMGRFRGNAFYSEHDYEFAKIELINDKWTVVEDTEKKEEVESEKQNENDVVVEARELRNQITQALQVIDSSSLDAPVKSIMKKMIRSLGLLIKKVHGEER